MAIESVHESFLITAEQLADMMSISERSIWRHLSGGKLLKPVRIGGSVRWNREQVRQWIADGCPPPEEA